MRVPYLENLQADVVHTEGMNVGKYPRRRRRFFFLSFKNRNDVLVTKKDQSLWGRVEKTTNQRLQKDYKRRAF